MSKNSNLLRFTRRMRTLIILDLENCDFEPKPETEQPIIETKRSSRKWREHVKLEVLIGIGITSRDWGCEGMDEILVGLMIIERMLMSKFCNIKNVSIVKQTVPRLTFSWAILIL